MLVIRVCVCYTGVGFVLCKIQFLLESVAWEKTLIIYFTSVPKVSSVVDIVSALG